ncbi:MAG: thiamine pyrophosphate-dependent dehydrogenase E1 component subunit alpha [Gammaproteobacteria bacterium]|nr:thiamine pyrophosphate-dependent dehydrogenase E1 component subunit alpha [Gammaproteobacteria bacterium]
MENERLEFFRRMVRIRRFESHAEACHGKGEIPGSLHTATGQEAEIVGSCMALRTDDYMVGNHRSHGHPIAKGAATNPLMAELFGRRTGVCGGKGGSMHLSDFSVGSLGETSIVGSGVPVAVGAALGANLQGSDRVSLCFFGDGATNEGAFHEGMNLASIWNLPVIFLCENNLYGVSTPASEVISVKDIAERGAAYSMKSEIVDGQDVEAVFNVVSAAVERARSGKGPTLVEAKTYRFAEHAANMGRVLLDRGTELDEWLQRDPIELYRAKLLGDGIKSEELAEIEAEVEQEILDSLEFARSSAYPDQAEAFTDVFTEPLSLPGWLAQ